MIRAFHGIHTASGQSAMTALFPYLGEPVAWHDYGWIAALESRRINPVVAGSVRPCISPDDVLIGHSNGCAIIYELIQGGSWPRGVVFINGALRPDFILPKSVKWAHVYWNAGDDYVLLATVGAAEGLVDPSWGDLGHTGYTGADPRVTNYNCGPQV